MSKSKVKTSGSEKLFMKFINKGHFAVDDQGRIWKLKTRRYDPETQVTKSKRIEPKRAETLFNNGYLVVQLSLKGKKKYCLAHRLVWTYFFGQIPEGYEVNHIDGDRENCSPDNLELLTHQENVLHSARELKEKRRRGELEEWVDPKQKRKAEKESEINIEINKDKPELHCTECKSSGFVGIKECKRCGGTGLVKVITGQI